MRKYLLFRHCEQKRLFVHLVNIGSVKDWGYPASEESRDLFPAYSREIFDHIDKEAIDLVLIDGRFRVACTLQVILNCHTNTKIKILIHDFWNREHYHSVLKYLDTVDKVETSGLFTIKENLDIESVRKDYNEYQFIFE